MENRRDPVKSKALAIVNKHRELAVQPHKADPGAFSISVKKKDYTPRPLIEATPPGPQHTSWEWETAQNEKPVKILSYMGNLPDQFGNDGDFYVDETTNLLYGPKTAGIWPETGVLATGLCKRTWVAFNRMRVPPPPAAEVGFLLRFRAFLRALHPGRLLKTIRALRA